MLSASLRSIAELCESLPTDRKVFVVPRGVSTNVARALALRGSNWANATFVTPRDLAHHLTRSDVAAAGLDRLHPDERSLWLFDKLPTLVGGPGSYYAGIRFGPSIVESFGSLLESLRLASVSAEAIRQSDIRADKKLPLANLLDAYERFLHVDSRFDDAALFGMAISAAARSKEIALLGVLVETSISPITGSFLDSFRAVRKLLIGDLEEYRANSAAANILKGWQNASAGSGETRGSVRTFEAIETLSSEHEVDGVLSDLLRKGYRLDDVELAYTSSRYLPIISSGLARLRHHHAENPGTSAPDLPASYADGIPITQNFVGQALVGYLQWLAGGLQSVDLANIAQTRALTFENVPSMDRLSPDSVSAFIYRRRVGAGELETINALDLWQVDVQDNRFSSDRDLRLIRTLRVGLMALFSIVPEKRDVSVADVILSAQTFLKKFVHKPDDSDRIATDLSEKLAPLGQIHASGKLSDVAGMLLHLIRRRRISSSAAAGAAIHVVPLEKCGYAGRKHVYIVGLDEKTFPGSSSDDPVLLDEERAGLSVRMATRKQRSRGKADALHVAVRSATDSITFAYSAMDPIFGREVERSTAVDALIKQHKIDVSKRSLGETVANLSDSGAVLSQLDRTAFDEYAGTHYPWLSAGQVAGQLRKIDPMSIYSGYLGGRTPELDVRRADNVVSASVLETLAKCPYQYFVRNILGVREPAALETRPGRWLSNLQFGNLLHELFWQFMNELTNRRERPDASKHTELLHSQLDAQIASWQKKVPSAGDVAMDRERHFLVQAADVFLRAETGRAVDAIAFEEAFGETPETNIPIVLADDVSIRLRGAVDRVDIGPDGFEIWDYKTGSARYFESNLHKDRARLQWALYAFVWTDVLRSDDDRAVANSGYFFTSGTANGERISAQPPDRLVFANRLRPLFQMTGEGAFPHLQVAGKACTICSYKAICESESRVAKDLTPQEVFDTDSSAAEAAVREWAQG